MNLADKFTLLRIIFAPVFFIMYFLPVWFPAQFVGGMMVLNVTLVWVIGIIAEITDMFDGMAARRLNQSSDFGKLFDPFADTFIQITALFCFVVDGIFPAVLFLVVLYREFGILFIRNLMLRKGIAMGARMGGKVKTVAYVAAGALAMFYVSLIRLGAIESIQPMIKLAAVVIFYISVLIAVLSFFDYLIAYRRAAAKNGA